MKNILSYQDYLSDSLKESLDPYIDNRSKFRIGDQVRVKDKIGTISAIHKKDYLVLIHGKNHRVPESQIEEIGPLKKKKKGSSKN